MTLPKQIKVAGINYEVVEKPFVALGDDKNYLGACLYNEARIELLESLADDRKEDVLVHELTHAIFNEAGYDNHDEEMIDRVGKVLFQVLKDNPRLLHSLVNE